MASETQAMMKPETSAVTRRETEQGRRYFVPATDILETQDAVILKLDMPGVSKEQIDITIDKGTMTITGTCEPEEAAAPVYRETRVGDYRRQFSLPEDVNTDRISAVMKAGVLTVTLHKPEEVKPKKIPISAAE